MENNYICTQCNKKYKSYQSLWNHNKRYHQNIKLSSHQKTTFDQLDSHLKTTPNKLVSHLKTTINKLSSNQKTTTIPSDEIEIVSDIDIKKFECKHCNKKFKHSQNKFRHQKKCGEKYLEKCNNLQDQLDTIKQEMEQLRKNILVVINKECKTHPKTLEKINKILSNTNNNVNSNNVNSNNIIINNYTNIIELGQEKVFDV